MGRRLKEGNTANEGTALSTLSTVALCSAPLALLTHSIYELAHSHCYSLIGQVKLMNMYSHCKRVLRECLCLLKSEETPLMTIVTIMYSHC